MGESGEAAAAEASPDRARVQEEEQEAMTGRRAAALFVLSLSAYAAAWIAVAGRRKG